MIARSPFTHRVFISKLQPFLSVKSQKGFDWAPKSFLFIDQNFINLRFQGFSFVHFAPVKEISFLLQHANDFVVIELEHDTGNFAIDSRLRGQKLKHFFNTPNQQDLDWGLCLI